MGEDEGEGSKGNKTDDDKFKSGKKRSRDEEKVFSY